MNLSQLVPAPARRWYETEHGRKMVRYSMVSVVAVPVGEAGILVGHSLLGMSPGWAGLFGNACGAVPSYYLNRTWVWGKNGRSHLMKEIVPFWVITVIGVAFAAWVVHLAGNYSSAHHWQGAGVSVLLLLANLAAFGVLWVGKYILFNTVLFKTTHPDDGPHTAAEHHEAGVAGAAGSPEAP